MVVKQKNLNRLWHFGYAMLLTDGQAKKSGRCGFGPQGWKEESREGFFAYVAGTARRDCASRGKKAMGEERDLSLYTIFDHQSLQLDSDLILKLQH